MMKLTAIFLLSSLLFSGSLSYDCGTGMIETSAYIADTKTTCEDCPTNCDECTLKNSEIVCSVCSSGYYLDEDLNCQTCYSNCSLCAGSELGDCIVPAEGLGYNPNTEEIDTCESTGCSFCPDSTLSKCYADCIDGYYAESRKGDGQVICKKCQDNCSSCYSYSDGNNSEILMCLECSEGYAVDVSSGYEECTDACGENCYYCLSDDGYCTGCNSGYTADDYGECQEDTASTSSDCAVGEFYDDSNEECTSCGENCLFCYSSTYCYSCEEGYVSSTGSCVACSVENCGSCSTYLSTETCSSCAVGYAFAFDPENKQENTGDEDISTSTRLLATGYDYEICDSCSLIAENCLSCSFEYGECYKCQDGYVFDSETESCIECEIEHCVSCETPGACYQCAAGYYPVEDGCEKCDSSCATCHGGSSKECSTCPLDKWSFWTPYYSVAETDSTYANDYATRAPGPFDHGFVGFSLQCMDKCPNSSNEGDEVQKSLDLRTCWVETDQEDLLKREFMDGQSLALSRTIDIRFMMEWVNFAVYDGYSLSSGITTDRKDDETVYLRKFNYLKEGEKYQAYAQENCVLFPHCFPFHVVSLDLNLVSTSTVTMTRTSTQSEEWPTTATALTRMESHCSGERTARFSMSTS